MYILSIRYCCVSSNTAIFALLAAHRSMTLRAQSGSASVGTQKHISGQSLLISHDPTFERFA